MEQYSLGARPPVPKPRWIFLKIPARSQSANFSSQAHQHIAKQPEWRSCPAAGWFEHQNHVRCPFAPNLAQAVVVDDILAQRSRIPQVRHLPLIYSPCKRPDFFIILSPARKFPERIERAVPQINYCGTPTHIHGNVISFIANCKALGMDLSAIFGRR